MYAGALTLWSGMAGEDALSGTQRKAANRWGSITRFTSRSPARNRNFESISLQRRVSCEPEFSGGHPINARRTFQLQLPQVKDPTCVPFVFANGGRYDRTGDGTLFGRP